MVTAGLYDIVLALGVEKLYATRQDEELRRLLPAPWTSTSCRRCMDELCRRARRRRRQEGGGAGQNRSMFMDVYAMVARAHMQRYGTTDEQFADGLGEELVPRQHEPARAVSGGADRRAGARRAA